MQLVLGFVLKTKKNVMAIAIAINDFCTYINDRDIFFNVFKFHC